VNFVEIKHKFLATKHQILTAFIVKVYAAVNSTFWGAVKTC